MGEGEEEVSVIPYLAHPLAPYVPEERADGPFSITPGLTKEAATPVGDAL